MKQSAVVKIDVEKNDRLFEFIMPIGAPYGEVYDTLFEMLKEVTDMMNKAAKQAEEAKEKGMEVKTDEDKEEEEVAS